MVSRSVTFVFLCMSLSTSAQVSGESDVFSIQRDALSQTLEQPLRTHLLKKGYTPRNAAIAANNLLDMYARCLANAPHTDLGSDPEVALFQLGETKVSAYKSLCLTEFLNDVASIP